MLVKELCLSKMVLAQLVFHMKKSLLRPFPHIIHKKKINPRWIQNINMKGKNIKLLEENTSNHLNDFWGVDDF